MVDGQDAVKDVWEVLDKIKAFTDKVRDGEWLGVTGKPLVNVVAIGIGGSFLGPLFVHTALRCVQMLCYALRKLSSVLDVGLKAHMLIFLSIQPLQCAKRIGCPTSNQCLSHLHAPPSCKILLFYACFGLARPGQPLTSQSPCLRFLYLDRKLSVLVASTRSEGWQVVKAQMQFLRIAAEDKNEMCFSRLLEVQEGAQMDVRLQN